MQEVSGSIPLGSTNILHSSVCVLSIRNWKPRVYGGRKKLGVSILGGAGAGAFGLFFIPLIFGGTAIAWLVVAVLAWILVLSRTMIAALVCFAISCGMHAIVFSGEPEAAVTATAAQIVLVFGIAAILAIPGVVAIRLATVFHGFRRRQK